MRSVSLLAVLALIGCENTKVVTEDTGVEPEVEPSSEDTDTDDTEETDTEETDTEETDTEETDTQDPDDADADNDGYSVNDGDCNDMDASLNLSDSDGDGQTSCDGDCNDSDADVYNGAAEVCDGQYNDCQDQSTQPSGTPADEVDADNDGFWACADDCDDDNADAYPGAAYNESSTACMIDADGDGYGEDLGTTVGGGCCYVFDMVDSYGDGWNSASLDISVNGTATASVGLTTGESARVDTVCVSDGDAVEIIFVSGSWDSEISMTITDPEGTEIYTADGPNGTLPAAGVVYSGNAVCENTTAITESGTDCDDTDAQAYPGATEIWYNNVDNDCAGDLNADFDQDGDGQASDQYGGQDCDDQEPLAYLGATEDPTDGIDNNCNGDIDEGFVMETIATNITYTAGRPIAIDVDNYGFTHVVYEDGGVIQYTNNVSGTWSTPTSAPTNGQSDAGMYIRGSIDGLDRFQIAFISDDGSSYDVNMMYVDTISGVWSNEWFVDTVTTGALTSEFQLDIDVDTNNRPTVGWYSQSDETPWILDVTSSLNATNSSISGSFTMLDDCVGFCSSAYTGTYLSLAIDNSDNNHVVFYNSVIGLENQYNIVYNEQSSPQCNDLSGFSTTSSVFIEEDSYGIYNDVAIMPTQNRAGVAYMDGVNNDLMYGFQTMSGCGGWNFELVDGSNAGYYNSLVYTSADQPYIAYYAASTADLKLASHNGSYWESEDVDTYGNVGQYLDMAIDGNDSVHIVYYDASTNSIKYAAGQ